MADYILSLFVINLHVPSVTTTRLQQQFHICLEADHAGELRFYYSASHFHFLSRCRLLKPLLRVCCNCLSGDDSEVIELNSES